MTEPITSLIHHPYRPPEGFAAPQPGVFKASTVIFPNVAALRARDWQQRSGYTYGLHGTPTTFTLEDRLCALEGGKHCLLVPSGLASIAHVNMALLAAGDEVLLPDNVYGPSKAFAQGELARWGITHRFYDAMQPQSLADTIGTKTKLVWLEAPGSVTMEFPDLRALVRICRKKKVLGALDNTWGAGLAFAPFDLDPSVRTEPPTVLSLSKEGLGVDISVHALTKYPSGGGDVLMGSVMTRDDALHLKLKGTHMRLGWGVGGNDVEAVLRSLPSMAVRYAAHDAAARELARWCQARPEIAAVIHPALEGSPGHEHWKALCTSAAGLFSVVFDERYTSAQVDAFCDALKLFKLGYSWGGPVSLVVPYDIPGMRGGSISKWPHKGVLVRFSIGLEAVADLQADLEQALAPLRK